MMRKLFPLATILAFSGVLAISCDKKEDDTNNTEGTAANPATEAVGAISLSNPGQLMLKASDALVSANVTGQSGTSLMLGDGSVSDNDSLCDNNGNPYDADAGDRLADGEDYAPRQFYCLVNSGVIESLETLPGFLKQQASIMCTLKENLDLNVDNFTADGKQYIEGDEAQNLTLSEDCWPQGMPDGQTAVPLNSVIGKTLAEDTGWQYQVNMTSEAMGLDFKMRYFSKDGIFGFTRYEAPEGEAGAGSGMSAIIDTVKGVILFDVFYDSAKEGENESYRRIVRLRVKGTFDGDLKFSEIDEARGFYANSGPGFDPAVGDTHVFSAYTVDGSNDGGYQFKSWKNSSEAEGTVEETYSKCADGDCENSTDIGTAADMKTLVFKSQAVQNAWTGFIDRKPACEPADNGADAISYSALLPNTGNFGVCE